MVETFRQGLGPYANATALLQGHRGALLFKRGSRAFVDSAACSTKVVCCLKMVSFDRHTFSTLALAFS